jgi:hypothetical protein
MEFVVDASRAFLPIQPYLQLLVSCSFRFFLDATLSLNISVPVVESSDIQRDGQHHRTQL